MYSRIRKKEIYGFQNKKWTSSMRNIFRIYFGNCLNTHNLKRPIELIPAPKIICIEFNPFLKVEGWREGRYEIYSILVDSFMSKVSVSLAILMSLLMM